MHHQTRVYQVKSTHALPQKIFFINQITALKNNIFVRPNLLYKKTPGMHFLTTTIPRRYMKSVFIFFRS